jgi:hypothetical protein
VLPKYPWDRTSTEPERPPWDRTAETYLGRPCKYNHETNGKTLRYESNGVCVKCSLRHGREKTKRSRFYKEYYFASKISSSKNGNGNSRAQSEQAREEESGDVKDVTSPTP